MSDLAQLKSLLATLPLPAAQAPGGDLDSDALTEHREALASPAVAQGLRADAYWPKWNSAWWRMTLAWELGLPGGLPAGLVTAMVDRLNEQYLQDFPFRIEDVPAGVDPLLGTMCHCGLGTMLQVLPWGMPALEAHVRLAWMYKWIGRYQMADGGLNCDEAAYLKSRPCSSFLSTLPPMEALLNCTGRDLDAGEWEILDRGAAYLLRRRLCRSLSKGGQVANPDWLQLTFPRFYEYDVLRGLSFVVAWALKRGRSLPAQAILESVQAVARHADPSGRITPTRQWHRSAKTRLPDAEGVWAYGHPVSTFPLLELAARVDRPCLPLTRSWGPTLVGLGILEARGLLNDDPLQAGF